METTNAIDTIPVATLSSKEALRHFFRQKRRELTKIEVFRRSYRITEKLFQTELVGVKSVHLFLPLIREREVNTYPIITRLWEKDIQVIVPKVVGNKMEHYYFFPHTHLQKNRWGIAEPVAQSPLTTSEIRAIDRVLVPLLVADKRGHRIGYGGGYYDRFLQSYPALTAIGLSLFPLMEAIKVLDNWDKPLARVLTPFG